MHGPQNGKFVFFGRYKLIKAFKASGNVMPCLLMSTYNVSKDCIASIFRVEQSKERRHSLPKRL